MAKKKPSPLGGNFRKIHPRLRMIANGSLKVNEVRSDFCSSIRVSKRSGIYRSSPVQQLADRVTEKAPKKGKTQPIPSNIEASVFVQRVAGEQRSTDQGEERLVQGGISHTLSKKNPNRELSLTAQVPLTGLQELADDDSVAWVELGEPLRAPTPVISTDTVSTPPATLRKFASGGGAGVLVGVIDVQGFDFAHRDFLDAQGNTRFEAIWDQGGRVHASPGKFGYGSVMTKDHMDSAIRGARQRGMPAAQLLEPQSQMVPGSHGTHVASIAAGNRGVCRKAFLAGVLISLPEEDEDRRLSFYDSSRIAHAVDWLFDLAEQLRRENQLDELPVALNISLGTNGHAHDGSSAVSRWIDSALSIPGRCVCLASGNAGQEAPETSDDLGFIMGRIHTSGRIPARGLDADLKWVVVGNGVQDVSENELEIWYSPADRFSVQVRPPGMDWTELLAPGDFIENRQLSDGSFISVYNELYHPANGANYIAIYLTPFLGDVIRGATPGVWQVRLHGTEIRDGRFHGWIERDDPRRLGRNGTQENWLFPSFFTRESNVDDSSVSSLGCGHSIVTVANLDGARERINITSSEGPTRDGRFKPDVAAPGTDIVAARGFGLGEGDDWLAMSGTSMASPYVTGVVGLMLARRPNLTAAQILGIIQRTAQPLPGANFNWRKDSGFGVIDPDKCLEEVDTVQRREDRT